jgi:chromosome segregation ATPase
MLCGRRWLRLLHDLHQQAMALLKAEYEERISSLRDQLDIKGERLTSAWEAQRRAEAEAAEAKARLQEVETAANNLHKHSVDQKQALKQAEEDARVMDDRVRMVEDANRSVNNQLHDRQQSLDAALQATNALQSELEELRRQMRLAEVDRIESDDLQRRDEAQARELMVRRVR